MINVLAVIGARLNSSRLPGKHLLDLAGEPLISRIFSRIERIKIIDKIVLATTNDTFNEPLVDWAKKNKKYIFCNDGDVNNLVGRIDTIVQNENPKIVVYICGDSPLIEPITLSNMISALVRSDADLVDLEPAKNAKKYIHEGFSVYKRKVWDRIVNYSINLEEKEHVGSALKKFSSQLKTIYIPEKQIYASIDHRISVDTPSDYYFMSELYIKWFSNALADSIVPLDWVVNEIINDKQLANINQNVVQKKIGQQSFDIILVCNVGLKTGLGHLSRTLNLLKVLQDQFSAGVQLLIQGDLPASYELNLVRHKVISEKESLINEVENQITTFKPDIVVFDINPTDIDFYFFLKLKLIKESVKLVAIDSFIENCDFFDLVIIPSFFLKPEYVDKLPNIKFGWDYFMLPQINTDKIEEKTGLIITIGGSDPCGLGASLPCLLDELLPEGTKVNWIQGPFASKPILPEMPRLLWKIHFAPKSLGSIMRNAECALSVYGVSFFELLSHGVPTVVFSPYLRDLNLELLSLKEENVAIVAENYSFAVKELVQLMENKEMKNSLSKNAKLKVDSQGAYRVAQLIEKLRAKV